MLHNNRFLCTHRQKIHQTHQIPYWHLFCIKYATYVIFMIE
jgi:hypothetical protein